jgi:uncharacterized protein
MVDPARLDSGDFRVSHESEPSASLLAGFSAFGLAGLTAVDFFVDQLELEERGHVTADGLPAITPFEEGRPRHHTRLFSRDDLDLTVLVGELPIARSVSEPFANAVLDWTVSSGVDDVAVLSGVPIPHGPEQHRTYYVATDDYRGRHLEDADVPPMGSGFLDGLNATLVERGIDSPLAVGVYVTPVHPQVPDVEAAIRLVETVSEVYGLDVDAAPLQAFAEEVRQYYEDLAERLEAHEPREMPEDRMYM